MATKTYSFRADLSFEDLITAALDKKNETTTKTINRNDLIVEAVEKHCTEILGSNKVKKIIKKD